MDTEAHSETHQKNMAVKKHQESNAHKTHDEDSDTHALLGVGNRSKSGAPTELMTQILTAASTGDIDVIHHLAVAEGEDVLNSQDMMGRTALMLGARHGYTACLCFLLNTDKVCINMQDFNGQTALMLAALHGHSDCVTCLLSTSDIDVKLRDKKGRTALLMASKKGHLECVRSLLDHYKLAMNSSDWEKERKLDFLIAVMKGHTDCAKFLLEAKTVQNVDDGNLELGSAIVLALRQCCHDCLQYIVYLRNPGGNVGRGTNPFKPDKDKEPRSLYEDVYLNTCSMFRTFLPNIPLGNQADMDNICVDTMKVANDLYCEIYSDPRMIYTMIWCVAAILYTPTECIYCLLQTGDSNVASVFKSCIDTVIAIALVNSHIDCVKCLLQSNEREITKFGLVISACKGNTEWFQYSLQTTMCNSDEMKHILKSGLLLAAANGHVECVKYLLDSGQVNVNRYLPFERDTAFTLSAKNGQLECVKFLFDTGRIYDINWEDGEGNTAFMLSARGGHVECVKYLVNTGQMDVNHKNRFEKTAFMLSAMRGHVDCVKYLLDTRQMHINQDNIFGETAFLLSAKEGQVECVRYLLDTGQIDINDHDYYGNSAFIFSAMNGHFDCVQCLLDTGKVDINHPNNGGNTAFMLSAMNGHVECVKSLLDTGKVDINDYNIEGNSAFTLSAMYGHAEIVKCLLDTENVDINDHNKEGNTAFMLSIEKGNVECAKYILNTGKVHVDIFNADTIVSIECAVTYKHPKCLDLLLEHIPDNQRVADPIRTIFLELAEDLSSMFYIPHFLNAGCFHWSWYPEFPPNRQRFLARALVISGYVPRSFEWDGKKSTPLHTAFMINDDGLVRYLVANLYLTPFDVENFQRDKNLQSRVISNGSESVKELHRELFGTPWRLQALSLFKISGLMRNEHRVDDMKQLDGLLPEYFLQLLGFRNSIRWLCLDQWEQIDVNYMCLLHGLRSLWLDESNMLQAQCCDDFCLRF